MGSAVQVAGQPRGGIDFTRPTPAALAVGFIGVWTLQGARAPLSDVQRELDTQPVRRVTFDSYSLQTWDTAILTFLDEPSAGLDPISSHLLDDLIRALRDGLGATVVVITHELAGIFTISDHSIFLDAETRTMIASGYPKELLARCEDPKVHAFLTRGEERRPTPEASA
jgi:hypothetical protein